MSTFAKIVACAVLIMGSTSAASAQTYKQLTEWCYGDATDDQTIQGCNAIVVSNQETLENKGNALANRGLAYKHKGQLDRALDDYNEAIRLSPNAANNYNLRGSCYDSLKQYQRAIQDYNYALKLKPNESTAYNNRGLAYVHLEQIDRGIQDYTQAIRLNPNYATAYSNRSLAYKAIGKLDSAKADSDKSEQLKRQGH